MKHRLQIFYLNIVKFAKNIFFMNRLVRIRILLSMTKLMVQSNTYRLPIYNIYYIYLFILFFLSD